MDEKEKIEHSQNVATTHLPDITNSSGDELCREFNGVGWELLTVKQLEQSRMVA